MVILLWAGATGLTAQPVVLETKNITERDGLLGYYNHDIIQHSSGWLWIASSLGLTRYDGYHFQTFSSFDSGLNGVNVEVIREYKDGRLSIIYLNERRFIDLFDPEQGLVEKISLHEGSGITGEVADLFLEARGDIFVLSRKNNRLYVQRYAGGGRFERLFSLSSGSDSTVSARPKGRLVRTREGRFWISDPRVGLRLTDASGKVLRAFYASDFGGANTAFARILYEDRGGNFWFSPQGELGLFRYDPDQKQFNLFRSLPTDRLYDRVWEDQVGNLLWKCGRQEWYSTTTNLYFLGTNGRVQDYSFLSQYNEYILSVFGQNFSSALYVGTGSIIRKLRFSGLSLKTYLSQPFEEGQWGVSIRGIGSDKKGNVFFIREVDSWYRLNLQTLRFDTIPLRVTERGDSIFWRQGGGIYVDDHYVWSVGRMNRQTPCLMRYDRKNGTFRAYSYPILFEDFLYDSRSGQFWLTGGTEENAELVCFDPGSETFIPYRDADGGNPLQGLAPIRMIQAADGSIWIGASSGLVHVKVGKRQSEVFGHGAKSVGLMNNNIEALYEDKEGRIWLGTNGGLHVFEPAQKVVLAVYNRSDGLAGNRISNIYPDSLGNFWVSTYSGLSYFDRREHRFYNLFRSDGLPFEEINRRTVYLDEQGRLYIGGLNGAASLLPSDVRRKITYPPPMLTRWEQFDGKADSLIVRATQLQSWRSVQLSSNVLFFECSFALPSYDQPETHRYSAWLENYDHKWNYLGAQPSIRYNKLPAGKYRLHIRAMDNHGNGSQEHLVMDIQVRQVFYRTAWFLILLFLLALAGGLWLYRFWIDRKMAIQRARELQELDALKMKLYTDITHEFRTPLTVIIGLADQLFQNDKPGSNREDLERLQNNAGRLLNLVNQVLDLRKLEAGSLQPQWIQADIVPLFRRCVESLWSLAESRTIELKFSSSSPRIVLDHDPEFFYKIISNLLSNALKFTPAGGQVEVTLNETGHQLEVVVRDNGIGLREEEIPHMFDRFYRAPSSQAVGIEGTGMGLTLVKELVELLKGTIEVRSNRGKGTAMLLRFPVSHQALPAEGDMPVTETALPALPVYAEYSGLSDPLAEDGKPLILVVEDNRDLAGFLHSSLQAQYQVIWAADGEAGIAQAIERIPDLILSDVMMPKKDGFELCRTLKNDPRTSHIPIILLTARTAYEDRLEGLKRGADAYLPKPFHPRELQLQIANLLSLTERLRQELSVSMAAADRAEAIPREAAPNLKDSPFDLSMEDAFIRRVEQIIIDNLANPDFTVMNLCQEVAMSKSQLHRKLTALTNEPASRLIRRLRLNRAMELLKTTEANISEIALQAGFNDPSYFTRIFNQDLGMTPSEYRTQFMK